MLKWLEALFAREDTAPPVPTDEPEVAKASRSISLLALAGARRGQRGPDPMAMDAQTVFAPYKPPAEVLPDGMAMDSCLPAMAGSMAAWAAQGAYHEGQGFFGYAYLAQLMQRAEYRHACEIWAEHAVRKWIKITGGSDAQRKAVEEEFDRLNVRDVFQEWMLNDHAYGRSQIFMDFGDADKPAELVTPLRLTTAKVSKSRPLQCLTVVEPIWSSPGAYATTNPLNRQFYKPTQWLVYGKRVDATRLLTLTSREVSDLLKPAYAFGGQSLVQLMKPYVDNWLRTRQAVSDMINSYSILKFGTDMSSLFNGGGGDDVFNRLDMFNQLRDNRGSFAYDKDTEELDNIAVPVSGLAELQGQSQEHCASVARIPLSIYLQITPSGLNASSDGETRNFYADVHAYQERNIRDPLMTVFDVVQFSLFGALVPGMTFEFNPLWELDEKEKAEIRKLDAEVDVAYVSGGIVSNEEVRKRLSNDQTSIYHGVDLTDPAPELPGTEDDDEADTTKETKSGGA